MYNQTKQFAADISARIASLESDLHKYREAFNTVKRNNGTRLFRKVIGIIFEVVAYLVAIASPFIIAAIGVAESETMRKLENALIGYERHVASLVHNSFLAMQLLAALVMLFALFTGYLLTKVRRRNNTVKDLTTLLENTLQATELNLKKARQTQHEFMEWAVKQGKEKEKAEETVGSGG